MSGIFPTFGWFSLGIKQALLYVMLADVCVEHGYEVSLYRHSAFFTIILVFFLCHFPAFLSVIIRLDRIIHAAEYHFLGHLLSHPPEEA